MRNVRPHPEEDWGSGFFTTISSSALIVDAVGIVGAQRSLEAIQLMINGKEALFLFYYLGMRNRRRCYYGKLEKWAQWRGFFVYLQRSDRYLQF